MIIETFLLLISLIKLIDLYCIFVNIGVVAAKPRPVVTLHLELPLLKVLGNTTDHINVAKK